MNGLQQYVLTWRAFVRHFWTLNLQLVGYLNIATLIISTAHILRAKCWLLIHQVYQTSLPRFTISLMKVIFFHFIQFEDDLTTLPVCSYKNLLIALLEKIFSHWTFSCSVYCMQCFFFLENSELQICTSWLFIGINYILSLAVMVHNILQYTQY